jgi:hypothetical protein
VFYFANAGQKTHSLIQLQQVHGNAFVQHIIQAKRTAVRSGDQHRHEADKKVNATLQTHEAQLQRRTKKISRNSGSAGAGRRIPLVIQRQQTGGATPARVKSPYYINFTNVVPPPQPDHSQENPGPSSSGADRAGYTSVRLRRRMTVGWDNLPAVIVGGVRMLPLYVRSANIFFRLDPIEVYVSSRYAVGSCPYRVTRRHERSHVSAFLRIFHRHRATMVERANAINLPTAASPRNVPVSNVDAQQNQVMEPVVQAIDDVRDLMVKEMNDDRTAKDTPSAYAQVYAQCPSSEW